MKFLILTFVLLAAVNVFADDFSDDENDAWNSFKLEHSKMFLSKGKEVARKKTFLANREQVLKLQAKADAGKIKYTPKIYAHADLNEEDFVARFGGFNHEESAEPVERTNFAVNLRQSIPSAFDARQKGWLGPVKQQGSCGSCWTFSSVCCIEAGLAARGYSGYDLSEQLLVDCGKRGGDGCRGGRMEAAFQYLAETGGAVQEHQYPYSGVFGQCRMSQVSGGIRVKGPVFPTADADSIKALLLQKGALSIAIDCTPWRFYGGGIFHGSNNGAPNHAVNLVGWGSEYGDDYWIVRNSWGEDFGEDGYIRLSTDMTGGYDLSNTWSVTLA